MRFLPVYLLAVLPIMAYAAEGMAPLHSDTLAKMADAEKAYYASAFSYAMETMDSGQGYHWQSYQSSGDITPWKTFISKSNAKCREFSEVFQVGGETGSFTGVGCKREGNEGWCKLKQGQMLSCALEPPGLANEAARTASETLDKSGDALRAFKNRWWPF